MMRGTEPWCEGSREQITVYSSSLITFIDFQYRKSLAPLARGTRSQGQGGAGGTGHSAVCYIDTTVLQILYSLVKFSSFFLQ